MATSTSRPTHGAHKTFAYLPQEVDWMRDLVRYQFGITEGAWSETWSGVARAAQKDYAHYRNIARGIEDDLAHTPEYRPFKRARLKEGLAENHKLEVQAMRREYIALLLGRQWVTAPPERIFDLETYGRDIT
jgi:hypothetical protein